MSEAEYFNEAIRYLAEDMNAEDRRAFEEFLQSDPLKKREVESLRKLWEQTGQYERLAPESDVSAQWSRFAKVAFEENSNVRVISPRWRQTIGIAASITLLIGMLAAWLLWPRDVIDLNPITVYAKDQMQEIDLPDGSKVSLNTESSISYLPDFEDRVVTLIGEAFFEVTHLDSDASFEVVTHDTKTTVLGTSFNVRAYPNEEAVEVEVYEGKVSFEDVGSQESVALSKDSGAEYDRVKQQMVTTVFAGRNKLFWKTQELEFNDDPLSKILADLSRAYGVEFEIENKAVLDCTYRTRFTKESIEQVLEDIEFGLNVTIEKEGAHKWVVKGEGCAPLQ